LGKKTQKPQNFLPQTLSSLKVLSIKKEFFCDSFFYKAFISNG